MSILDWMIFDNIAGKKADEVIDKIQEVEKRKAIAAQQSVDAIVSSNIPPETVELLHWISVSRLYIPKVNRTKLIIFLVVCFFAGLMIMAIFHEVIYMILFFVIVLATLLFLLAKPIEVDTVLTNKGILYTGLFYPWIILNSFNTTEKLGFGVVIIRTNTSARQLVIVADENIDKIKEILQHNLSLNQYLTIGGNIFVLDLLAKLLI
ncbi:hypothetical protein HY029_01460 [Candidatus Gottesmanbacteria bacterium]|nr:hypothetical protein [Candidatus Gottesmanbacteria bacterium]